MISHEQFAEFARQGYNRIPVALELLADLDTPLSVYLKVANQPYSYLFESVHGGERWGRYSIIGLPSRRRLVVTGHSVQVYEGDILQDDVRTEDPLAYIEQYQTRFKVPAVANLPRFTGGLVGYFGYDCVRYVEKKLAAVSKPDPIGMPDIQLMLSEEVIVFDNLKESIYLITHADPGEANAYARSLERLEQLAHRLRTAGAPAEPRCDAPPTREGDFRSGCGESVFKQGVERIKEYILAGDVMQVVPSQRLTAPYGHSPMALYRALRHLNPSPYMYFVNCGNAHIVGSSPEILARSRVAR